jgi:CRISPR-associated protein (TIGR02710 family)
MPAPPCTVLLASVGGSIPPVLHSLRLLRPRHVWYFCSPASRSQADQIQQELDWHPFPRFIEVERFEELGPCYQILRSRLPEILKEARVDPAEVVVDYTGGTKTMSAALVLAATELFGRFSYVGGHQREKDGLGVTIGGKELVHYQNHPWQELAVREVERATDLWSVAQFEAVARLLHTVGPRVPQPLRFKAIEILAEGLAARHRLDFPGAKTLLTTALGRLRPLFESHPDHSPIPFVQEVLDLCEMCVDRGAGPELLSELLDNALRTARQGRYEDAAARLYRAMELQGQIWLRERTGGLFTHGRCRGVAVSELPVPLRDHTWCQPNDQGEIRLGLNQVFRALHLLGEPHASAVVSDMDRLEGCVGKGGRWRAATEQRNTSILAHGVNPIGEAGFERMRSLATEFLGFSLATESHPIPRLDPRWLGQP